MSSLKRKLIFSIWAIVATVVTLASTTYAWFAQNREGWTDEFELQIENSDGLLISVDGVNYYNEITNDMLFKAIAAKRNNVSYNEVTEEMITTDLSNLAPVTTTDLENFTTIDSASAVSNGKYEYHKALINTYIQFDLWIKVETSKGEANKTYSISFVDQYGEGDKPYITGADSTVRIHNNLSSTDKDYASGTTITVNPVNSMRIGVKKDNDLYIYEPYMGFGSYALENATEDIYNPNKNAMLTYFNNSHTAKIDPLADEEVYRNTIKSFDNAVSFGNVVGNEDKTEYTPLKLTISIWLEGMDADYFEGVNTNSVKVYLNFTMKEVNL